MTKANPYSPPRHGLPLRPQRTFQIGTEHPVKLVLTSSFWTGIHCTAFDAAGESLVSHRGTGKFLIAAQEPHEVEIATDPTARIQLFIDGEMVEGNLFAHARRNAFLFVGFFIGFLLLAIALLFWRFF